MSYARFSDGDVYVFTSRHGLECCFCRLQEREWVDDPSRRVIGGYFKAVGEKVQDIFDSNAGMIEHLERHRAAGHDVPEYAFTRLRDPLDAAENEDIWEKARIEATFPASSKVETGVEK